MRGRTWLCFLLGTKREFSRILHALMFHNHITIYSFEWNAYTKLPATGQNMVKNNWLFKNKKVFHSSVLKTMKGKHSPNLLHNSFLGYQPSSLYSYQIMWTLQECIHHNQKFTATQEQRAGFVANNEAIDMILIMSKKIKTMEKPNNSNSASNHTEQTRIDAENTMMEQHSN